MDDEAAVSSKKKFPCFWLVVVLLGSLLSVFAVAFILMNLSQSSSKEVVAVVSTSGGLCTEGVCHSEATLYGDGRFGEDTQFSESEVEQLQGLIAASDLRNDLVPAEEFLCPSAYDGSDTSYSFPSKYGDEKFTLCTYESPEDNELIGYLQGLLQSSAK